MKIHRKLNRFILSPIKEIQKQTNNKTLDTFSSFFKNNLIVIYWRERKKEMELGASIFANF